MASRFKVSNLFGGGVFLCYSIFIFSIDLENPLPLNVWQYVLIILAAICYILYIKFNIKEKNWFLIFSYTLAVIVLGYCVSLLFTPVSALT